MNGELLLVKALAVHEVYFEVNGLLLVGDDGLDVLLADGFASLSRCQDRELGRKVSLVTSLDLVVT